MSRRPPYCSLRDLSRRHLMQGAASLTLWSMLPGPSVAATRDPRLLVVVLRGALDGLALAAPVGDPDYAGLRRELAMQRTGDGAGLPLDGLFVLNPAMPHFARLYTLREAMIVHAVATPYRARSHFDGQDVLESGLPGVGRVSDGWLNRALTQLPAAGRSEPAKGLTIAAVMPLIMRGAAPVLTWSPKVYGLPLAQSTTARLMDLYGQRDPRLAAALAEGLEIDRVAVAPVLPAPVQSAAPASAKAAGTPPEFANSRAGNDAKNGSAPAMTTTMAPVGPMKVFVDTAANAARLMSGPGGPRIGAISFDGWDTHANEGLIGGQLANRLAGLDGALRAFADGMGPAWKDTVVIVITEFGRTAATNGTGGTDHGTATVALLAGGAAKGGRVVSNWPGLSARALFEGRDLAATIDLRGVLKGVLADHLGLSERALANAVFPDSGNVRPMQGLLA